MVSEVGVTEFALLTGNKFCFLGEGDAPRSPFEKDVKKSVDNCVDGNCVGNYVDDCRVTADS
jgi:hypothetical protein